MNRLGGTIELTLLTIAALFVAVLFVEYRRVRFTARQFVPPQPRQYLPSHLNVPPVREHQQTIENVGYLNVDDASYGEYD